MSKKQNFGEKLKELRVKAGMTQRELAEKVNVDFTYLSKIENGALPPPSERVILHLTEVLNADKDELIMMAGKIPPDIAEILMSREALRLLRSDKTRKQVQAADGNNGGANIFKLLKGLSKVAIPILLVIAVATSLWYVSPTQALDIGITLPSDANLGSEHTFTVTVTVINPQDIVPIQTVNATIYNSSNPTTYKASLSNLPKTDSSRQAHTVNEGSSSGSAEVAATTGAGWYYTYGSGYAAWSGGGYTFGSVHGYAYAYTGQTQITYTVYWTSPSGWPAGDYTMEVSVTARSPSLEKIFTETSGSTFALSAATTTTTDNGGLGGGVAAPGVTAEDIEGMADSEAAETLEDLDSDEAAAILEDVETEKAADVLEVMATDKAADIIEEVDTDKAADIIEEVDTDKAADIIEEVDTDKAADIIEEVDTDKAADIIEEVSTDKSADLLEEIETETAAAIMEELSTDKLNDTIPEMSEESLTDRLPELTPDKLYSVDTEVLLDSLPNLPAEWLIGENTPESDLDEPTETGTTPDGIIYESDKFLAGQWVLLVSAPMPVDRLMIKATRALDNLVTTLEVFDERPEVVYKDLPRDRTILAYLNIMIENAEPEDIEVGHITFKVEKDWLEENSLHKWSIELNRYDPEINNWYALSCKRVEEDDTYVYYTASITRFSIFAITGGETVEPLAVEVGNLSLSPSSVEAGEDVNISVDVANPSTYTDQTYAVILWLNGTVETGQDITLAPGETSTVSFTVAPDSAGDYEVRVDRLFSSVSVTRPALPTPTPAPTPTPTPTPTPVPTPPAPVPEAPLSWWMIIGIIVAGLIVLATVLWFTMVRRRD